jgi:hypothetical protein
VAGRFLDAAHGRLEHLYKRIVQRHRVRQLLAGSPVGRNGPAACACNDTNRLSGGLLGAKCPGTVYGPFAGLLKTTKNNNAMCAVHVSLQEGYVCGACRPGFFRATGDATGPSTCSRCSNVTCTDGELAFPCTADSDAYCSRCTGLPEHAFWTNPHASTACSWACKQGYFPLHSSCKKCDATPAIVCAKGSYITPCGNDSDYRCAQCATGNLPANAVFIEPRVLDRDSSCPWQCYSFGPFKFPWDEPGAEPTYCIPGWLSFMTFFSLCLVGACFEGCLEAQEQERNREEERIVSGRR